MISPCFEFPIPRNQFTPEKGKAQLERMQACYDREERRELIMLAVVLAVAIVGAIVVLLAIAVRSMI